MNKQTEWATFHADLCNMHTHQGWNGHILLKPEQNLACQTCIKTVLNGFVYGIPKISIETSSCLKTTNWKQGHLSPRPSTVQATWTSKRREAWPPHSDLNNNRYVPFEWKPHKQEGNLEDEICAGETPCAGHSNEFHLFCEYPEQRHVPLRAAHRHLSYFLRSLVGAFYTTTNRLSIFDTSLPIEKTKPCP